MNQFYIDVILSIASEFDSKTHFLFAGEIRRKKLLNRSCDIAYLSSIVAGGRCILWNEIRYVAAFHRGLVGVFNTPAIKVISC